MFNSNSIYSVSVLDECQQTLDVVADKVSFMSNKFRKWVENSLNGVKNIAMRLRGILNIYRRKYQFVQFVGLNMLLKMVVILV